jgi:hypothetical protein
MKPKRKRKGHWGFCLVMAFAGIAIALTWLAIILEITLLIAGE